MLEDMGPRRPLSKIGIIFGDGIFAGEGLLKILGIQSTCKICLDTYHLLSSTDGAWPKFFGSQAWPRLKEDFTNLVYSKTIDIYTDRHEALKERLAKENNHNWNKYLCSFCKSTGHRKGNGLCEASTKLETTFVDHEGTGMLSFCLGHPTTHAVEIPSNALARSFSHMNWSAEISEEVFHVVLIRCYYSRGHTQYMSRKASIKGQMIELTT
jgi:hypothetical protein